MQVYIYRTYFNLDYPVLDINEARDYLGADSMEKYLKSDTRIAEDIRNAVVNIKWILTTEMSGHIDLVTSKELNDTELKSISDWVSGQNSDGLGEGFEQQDFACYDVDEDGDPIDSRRAWDYEGETETVMASFDWQTNEYIFEFVRSE